jgi:chorismate mutase
MTLDEWCERLPESHSARVELRELRATVSRLRCDAQGFHDAAIKSGQEIAGMMAALGRNVRADETAAQAITRILAERDALAQDAARLREAAGKVALLYFAATKDYALHATDYNKGAVNGLYDADAILDAALSTTTEAKNG